MSTPTAIRSSVIARRAQVSARFHINGWRRTRWQSVRRVESRRTLQQGISRGELRKDTDVELVLDALYGPLYYRLLVKHAPLTPGYADALVDLVFPGLEV